MKIRKIGRERPILYRGRFDVPKEVIARLAVARNHFILAQIAHFNGKVDQYYLTIDNILSAIIVARKDAETFNHREKIRRFFKHLGKRAKARLIDKSDFVHFFNLWQESRYKLYFPSSSEVSKMELFASHLLDFAVTEIARIFKSDETRLAKEVEKLLSVYQSEAILQEAGHIHEWHEIEAERLGEMDGTKLARKLANSWNFMDVSLLTDRREAQSILDHSEKAAEILSRLLNDWDELVSHVKDRIIELTVLEIAGSRTKKSDILRDTVLKEAFEDAAKRPETWKLRLVVNLALDAQEPKEVASSFLRMRDMIEHVDEIRHKAVRTGWENLKQHSFQPQSKRNRG